MYKNILLWEGQLLWQSRVDSRSVRMFLQGNECFRHRSVGFLCSLYFLVFGLGWVLFFCNKIIGKFIRYVRMLHFFQYRVGSSFAVSYCSAFLGWLGWVVFGCYSEVFSELIYFSDVDVLCLYFACMYVCRCLYFVVRIFRSMYILQYVYFVVSRVSQQYKGIVMQKIIRI